MLNDSQDITLTQEDIVNDYSKKPSVECTEDTVNSEKNCTVCFKSKSKEKHSENEIEVTDKRDVETIGQVETARMLNTTSYETG